MAYAKVASLGASGAWGKHDVGFKRGGRKEESWKKKKQNTKLALKDQQPQLLLCVAYFVFWYV